MATLMKCAACGADVEFSTGSKSEEVVCPGCEVLVRRRPGDSKMAMPVGMELPEEFRPLDLKRLGKQSELLVGRYNKRAGEQASPGGGGSMGSAVDLTLAKALESLAHTIGHLDERLSAQERRSGDGSVAPLEGLEAPGETDVVPANGFDSASGAATGEEDAEQVVQLEPVDHESHKARPLGAPVLVRREAAREAHHFRRERQRHWDDRGREEVKVGWFSSLMEKAPKTTVTVTVMLALSLVVATIFWVDGSVFTVAPTDGSPDIETTRIGLPLSDDPEAERAEDAARAFLSSTSAKVAKPFVFQAEKISQKFMELYRPIRSPDDYELILQSRAMAPGGQSVFAFRVSMADEASQTLVVLPDGSRPKVFWEFFAEVGDFSWQEFMEKRPTEPVMMRVWAYKGDRYQAPYTPDEWQCYVLHDYSEKRNLYGYARKNEKEDWRLSDALENRPVKFGRRDEVMAQVELVFMTEMTRDGEGREYVVEIKGVPVVSWLPAEFVPRNTAEE